MSKDFFNPVPARRAAQIKTRSTFNDMTLPGSQAPRARRPRVQRRHELLPPEIAEDVIEEYETEHAQNAITRKRPLDSPPPCFYFSDCKARAELEKVGKAVCSRCAVRLQGQSYPLRKPGESSYADVSRGRSEARCISAQILRASLTSR